MFCYPTLLFGFRPSNIVILYTNPHSIKVSKQILPPHSTCKINVRRFYSFDFFTDVCLYGIKENERSEKIYYDTWSHLSASAAAFVVVILYGN